MLVRLDNEVIFKKAFRDPLVLSTFVRDVTGVDVQFRAEDIETEKSFYPKTGSINFRYDIYAEDPEHRIVVEIQKVDYDHNFDRFLHYHLQAITEQQRTSDDYTIPKRVYSIVVITAPYKIKGKSGQLVRDELLVSKLDPRNLEGHEQGVYNHELYFLNPSYRDGRVLTPVRDWLDLIYESIRHPENPSINFSNPGIKRASELADQINLSPDEWAESKIAAARLKVLELEHQSGIDEGFLKGKAEGKLETARNLKMMGLSSLQISQATGLSVQEIESLK
jgi:predicted transposase/invertase (TIGR01784 family)